MVSGLEELLDKCKKEINEHFNKQTIGEPVDVNTYTWCADCEGITLKYLERAFSLGVESVIKLADELEVVKVKLVVANASNDFKEVNKLLKRKCELFEELKRLGGSDLK